MSDTGKIDMSLRSCRWIHRKRPAAFAVLLMTVCGIGLPQASLAAPPGRGGPPPTVTVATVRMQAVNPPKTYVGRMEAIQAVDLRARVEGFLERIAFQEGADVNAGDLLYVIEQAPYRARVDEARAKVAETEAALTRARQYRRRLQNVKSGGVSATDLDTAVSNQQQAEARLQEAKANLTQARLNLGYTTIRAPVSGRIGRTAYTRGNLVGPSSGALARIVQIDPIRVLYSMSENDYMQTRTTGDGTHDDFQDRFVPRLRMPGGSMFAHAGRIDFFDNQVDPGTGTIAVRAVFDNPQRILVPGQYVTVVVNRSEARQLPVIPQSSVLEDREGRYVFVVDRQKTVQKRRIVTDGAIDNQWMVEKGLSAGETIIVQGVQKVTPGQVVQPSPENKSPKE